MHQRMKMAILIYWRPAVDGGFGAKMVEDVR
jgi:hypothetical protein